MKNSFCRICRGRFNLKYPPAAVDSKNTKSSAPPRTISVRIEESGEISDNICWDCEETLLGFHNSAENDEDEELVVVDDDEILYKSLENSKRNHRLSKETEVIEIDSSDSDDIVIIPQEEKTISVEAARTNGEKSKNQSGAAKRKRKSIKSKSKNTASKMKDVKEDNSPRGRICESKQCPICPYHSGIEFEIVCHIRQTHPQYRGDCLRFDYIDGDSLLTRRIIFAQLWTFFECKECGKIYDRFSRHTKHITTHDRKKFHKPLPLNLNTHINNNNNNNNNINSEKKESIKLPPPPPPPAKRNSKSLKRPLDEIIDSNRSASDERVKKMKISNDQHPSKTLVVKLHKSENASLSSKQQSQSEKSKSRALLRKQQQLALRREKRRQKKEQERMAAALKGKKKTTTTDKPMFKMPTQPAPRASAVIKPVVQKQIKLKLSLTCKMCSKTFPGFIPWNSHMIRNHAPDELQRTGKKHSTELVCRSCDKQFDYKSRLLNHIRFSHRRKNRKFEMEVNGNDQKEICCQSETELTTVTSSDSVPIIEMLEKEESKDCDDHQLPITTENSLSETNSNEETKDVALSTSMAKSALLCQYCGSLFASDDKAAITDMAAHHADHVANGDVHRFLVTKQQQPKV